MSNAIDTASQYYRDFVARIITTATEAKVTIIAPSSSFVSSVYKIYRDGEVLKSSLKNLWDNYEYNQEYTSFLLGSYSKEEFKERAKKYARNFEKNINDNELVYNVNLIFSVLNRELTSNDLSILLNVDCSQIEKALKKLGKILNIEKEIENDDKI